MTWGGAQGFQTPIAPDSFLIDGFGASGISHEERGLAYYEVVLSGHMLPGYAPWVRSLQSWVDMKLIVAPFRRQFKACSISWANETTYRCMRCIFHTALDAYFNGKEISNIHPSHPLCPAGFCDLTSPPPRKRTLDIVGFIRANQLQGGVSLTSPENDSVPLRASGPKVN